MSGNGVNAFVAESAPGGIAFGGCGFVLERFRFDCIQSKLRLVLTHPPDEAAERMGQPSEVAVKNP
jgi:hypothetical protein